MQVIIERHWKDPVAWSCLPPNKTPDFTDFCSFEMHPVCRFVCPDGGGYYERYEDCSPSTPIDAWTVFGRSIKTGKLVALHDCNSASDAIAVLQFCRNQSGNSIANVDTNRESNENSVCKAHAK